MVLHPHETHMHRCLQLAQLGAGRVSANPMVGCVVVHNGHIIGEGYHQQYGAAHAEVNAIKAVADKSLLKEATLYVNLEPCAHHGKTPPCADLIVQLRLKKVVIGTVDTFSKVAGKGIEKLQSAGIEVTVGVLQDECRWLNRRFFTFHEKKRPYIVLKWAQTADGFMGRGIEHDHLDKQISNPYASRLVHRWRSEEDSILVGKTTALLDNPALTTRLWPGKNPIRVVMDRELEIPHDYKIFNGEAPTIIFNERKQAEEGTVHYEKVNFDTHFTQQLLQKLYEKNIQSVLVEGGRQTLQIFIEGGHWDEARIITSPKLWAEGVKAPDIKGNELSRENIAGDIISILTY